MDIKRINELISDGNILDAINYLSTQNLDKNLKNEVKVLLSRYNTLRLDYRKGLLQQSEYNVELNKITVSIVELMDSINTNDRTPLVESGSKRNIIRYFVLPITLILSIVALFNFISKPQEQSYSPPSFNLSKLNQDSVLTLTFLNEEKEIRQAIKIPNHLRVVDLKKILRENYEIWPRNRSEEFNYDRVDEYLVADNRIVKEEELSLRESDIKNNDIIAYRLSYVLIQRHTGNEDTLNTPESMFRFPVIVEVLNASTQIKETKVEGFIKNTLGEESDEKIEINGVLDFSEKSNVVDVSKLLAAHLKLTLKVNGEVINEYQVEAIGETRNDATSNLYVELHGILYKIGQEF